MRVHVSSYNSLLFYLRSSNVICVLVSEHFVFSEDNGYWRQFGYGIISCHRSDFDAIGGFNLDIKGWGKEDVDLFEKFLHHSQQNPQFEIFRGANPGIVHIFHDIECDDSLDPAQLIMCLGSRAASISGQRALASLYLSRLQLNRSERRNSSDFIGLS